MARKQKRDEPVVDVEVEPPEAPFDEGDGADALHDALARYGRPLLAAVCVVAVALSAWSIWRGARADKERRASVLLTEARGPEQIRELVTRYPRTAAAGQGLLRLATLYYQRDDFVQAREVYEEFTATHPEHELREVARLGVVSCIEAEGRHDEALQGYDRFLAEHPGHFLSAQADLGRARCLELLGRLTEARIAYENLVASAADTSWAGIAEGALERVNRELRRVDGAL